MPAFRKSSIGKLLSLESIALLSVLLLAVGPASAQSPGAGGQTPKQPTANDASVGLPEQPASMSKNPVAMTPDAARNEGAAQASPEAGKK